MHGLQSDSNSMIGKNSFVYYLLDKGFDVWFGNNRGDKFSLSHVKDQISDKDYYNYSFEEMGLYDIPTFYRTILAQYSNENQKIIYFGHSNGTTQMFIGLTDPKTKNF